MSVAIRNLGGPVVCNAPRVKLQRAQPETNGIPVVQGVEFRPHQIREPRVITRRDFSGRQLSERRFIDQQALFDDGLNRRTQRGAVAQTKRIGRHQLLAHRYVLLARPLISPDEYIIVARLTLNKLIS